LRWDILSGRSGSQAGKQSGKQGRLVKIYGLSGPFYETVDSIEQEKKKEATNQIALVQKVRYHLR